MTAVSEGQPRVRTPQWLLQPELAMCPCGCIGKRRKGSYLEKTITGVSGLLQQVMFSQDVAEQRGLMQRVDPRVKVAGLVVLLVATGLVRNLAVLAACYAATLALAAASALPIWFFVKRVWLFVPIFTGIMVLPATLSIVSDGPVVLTLWHWHGQPEGFTAQGLTAAALVVSRVAVSISLVVLLTLTTPWNRLLAALRAIGVPKMFVLVIGMAYRYIFLLLTTVSDMFQARKARMIGATKHDKGARAFVGATAGALIGKAHHLSEEVHQAMTARGYRGDAKTLERFRFTVADAACAATVLAAAVLIIGGDRFLGR
ncbi:cobalt ECF transporter T component CbiQ [Sphaerisporangium fuscum]|uniref:cobalt ECF transporter T component CbiQ n=1 Tax=Sphaerisporangium fuscum TaxID=2835868 RepID=UPI001BDD09E1|nr:cobalt ECF transporter T component CbiQ [Sphaerisporangium fuscum]